MPSCSFAEPDNMFVFPRSCSAYLRKTKEHPTILPTPWYAFRDPQDCWKHSI